MSLIAHYTLNGNAKDYFGNDGNPSNVSWVDGKIGKGASYDGDASAIEIGSDFLYREGATDFSICGWVYFNSFDTRDIIFLRSTDGDKAPYAWLLGVTENGTRISAYDSTSFKSIDFSFSTDTWYHISFCFRSGDVYFYIDGDFLGSRSVDFNDDPNFITMFGGHGSGNNIDGILDDVRVFDHALSEREVKNLCTGCVASYLFNEGSLADSTGNRPSATLGSSAPTFIQDSISGGGAYSFNRDNSELVKTGESFPEIVGDTSFTLEAWIKLRSASAGSGGSGYSIVGHAGANGFGMQVFGQKINFGSRSTGNLTGNIVLDLEKWYHITCVREAGVNGRIYVNAVLDATATNLAVNATSDEVQIGHAEGRVGAFDGEITGVKIYNTALSDEQIRNNYQTGLAIDNSHRMHSRYLNEPIAYQFNWEDAQPFSWFGLSSQTVQNGYLRIVTNHMYPRIHMYNLGSFDPNKYNYIQVRYRIAAGVGGSGRIFYTNSEYTSANGANRVNLPLVSDGNWHVADVFMADHPNWYDSNITGWRFDPCSDSGVTVDIDYIRLVSNNNPLIEYGETKLNEFSEVGVTHELKNWLPLNNNSKDRVTNKTATVIGAVPIGDGYSFDGAGDWIEPQGITSTDVLCESTNQFSICARFNYTNSNALRSIFGASGGYGGSATFVAGVDTNDTIRIVLKGAGSTPFSGLTPNNDYFICVTWDGNTALVYLNDSEGVSVGVGTASDQQLGLAIGQHRATSPNSSYPFYGLISSFKYFNTVLTPEEVAQEYQSSSKAMINKSTAFAKEFIEV